MKLELKNIKYCKFASQETACYEAKLYVDGKPFALVGNEGHGGCDYQYSLNDQNIDDKLRDINKYLSTSPKMKSKFHYGDGEMTTHEFTVDLELWCGEELNKWINSKKLKRILKKGSMILDSKGDLFYWKHFMLSDTLKKHHPNSIILNDLPFEKALDVFMNKDPDVFCNE